MIFFGFLSCTVHMEMGGAPDGRAPFAVHERAIDCAGFLHIPIVNRSGVRFPEKKHYKDCHYIHFQTPFISTDDFPYSADVPISIRWPVTEWQLTVTAHDRLGSPLLEVSRFFRNISSHSPITDMTIEAKNLTISFSFSVECEENFYGPACTIFCNETFKDQNGGSFKCSLEGKKICEPGWSGSLCNEPRCDHDCVHGTCVGPNTCRCDFGWRGVSCSECVPLAGCQHGSCRTSHQCECHPGWGGVLCDVDLDYCAHHRDICRNGGVCLADSLLSYRCNCSAGYEGRNCERLSKVDCSMIDCGVRICVMAATPRCECPPGYVGDRCEYFESDLKPLIRIDVLLISLALFILSICLAVVSILNHAGALYSTHWVAAEVHVRSGGKESRSSSPPPTYDTGQGQSPCISWRRGSTDLVQEVSV
ncbi:EGF-like domain protein [Necator americanus]|uniref:Delta-like protein n=1 Tax=Necator americanus TaxID=51031 RepID=W2TFN2_NECAM|nr:EGF-like domain protein [Necator americanus]ETN80845.1 EGF-like domain protein [Necator americanus]